MRWRESVALAVIGVFALVASPSYFALGRVTAAFAGNHQGDAFRRAQRDLRGMLARDDGDPVRLRNKSFRVGAIPKLGFPGYAAVFVLTYPENSVAGRSVYFQESSREIRDRYRAHPGCRMAKLLVAPGEIEPPAVRRSRERPPR